MSFQNTRMGTKSVALPHSLHDLDKHNEHIISVHTTIHGMIIFVHAIHKHSNNAFGDTCTVFIRIKAGFI